jgi:hypothetical protein
VVKRKTSNLLTLVRIRPFLILQSRDCKLLSSNGQDVALSRRKYEFDSHREYKGAFKKKLFKVKYLLDITNVEFFILKHRALLSVAFNINLNLSVKELNHNLGINMYVKYH